MTVEELLNHLKDLPGNARVVVNVYDDQPEPGLMEDTDILNATADNVTVADDGSAVWIGAHYAHLEMWNGWGLENP